MLTLWPRVYMNLPQHECKHRHRDKSRDLGFPGETTMNTCTWSSHYISTVIWYWVFVLQFFSLLGKCPFNRILPFASFVVTHCSSCLARTHTHRRCSSFFTQLSGAITQYQILSNAAGVQSASTRCRAANARAPPLTLTAGFGSVPLWSLAAAHDTCQSGVALEQVAGLTIKCHHGAQLVVGADSGPVHYIARIKARLPQFCCKIISESKTKQKQKRKGWEFVY